jgi:GTPase SAR1 family protein
MATTQEKLSMIVVMGVTGAGKSYFINRLAGREVVQEGADLDSCKIPEVPGFSNPNSPSPQAPKPASSSPSKSVPAKSFS